MNFLFNLETSLAISVVLLGSNESLRTTIISLIFSIFPSPRVISLLQNIFFDSDFSSSTIFCSPVRTTGFICSKQNSGLTSFDIFTANSISTGHPRAFLPIESISFANEARGMVSHFNIGANETTLVPNVDKESLIVLSSCEITLPIHFNEPSSSASFRS